VIDALIGVFVTIVGGLAIIWLTTGGFARRRAIRKALGRTSGDTGALKRSVRKHRPQLRPTASDADELREALASLSGQTASAAQIDQFLAELHREFVDAEMAVVWDRPEPRVVEVIRGTPLSALVGRSEEISAVQRLVRDGIDCVISGPPGIGKTRLLEAVRDAHTGPCVFVRLEQGGEPMRDIRLALNRFARGAFPVDDDEGLAMLQRSVPPGVLVLVDNADAPNSAQAVRRVASHLPALRFVVTSRGALIQGFAPVGLEPLNEAESEQLLAEGGFNASAETRAEVIRAGGGNPLLTLQASWAVTRREDPKGDPTVDRMQMLVEEVRSSSPDLLRVIGDLPSAYHPARCLSSLADEAVFETLGRNAVMRHVGDELVVIHETLRQSCRNFVRLTSAEVVGRARDETLRSYVTWLGSAASHEDIDLVLPNILHLLTSASDDSLVIAASDSLCGDNYDDPNGYLAARGVGSVLLDLSPRVHAAAAAARTDGAARVLKNLGIFAYWTDDARAEEWLYEARAIFEELHDGPGMAACTWMLGAIADDGSRYGDAESFYRQPLTWLTEPRALAISHHLVGCSLYHQGKLSEARREFEFAASLAASRDEEIRSRLDRRLAYLELAEGRLDTALAQLVAACSSAEALGRPRNVARISRHIGEAHLARGDADQARQALEESRRLFEALGDNRGLGGTLRSLGRLEASIDNLDVAYANLEQSRSLALGRRETDCSQPARSVFGVAAAEEELARVCFARGSTAAAERHLRVAANAFQSIGHPRLACILEDFDFVRNEPVPRPAAVIFDLIDTIAVRDRRQWHLAEGQLAEALGIDLDLLRAVWRRSRGRASTDASWTTEGRIAWVAEQLSRSLTPASISEFADEQRRLWREAVRLRPSVVDDFEALRDAGVRVAVLTNGSISMDGVIDHLGLSGLATGLLSCQIGVVKPHASAYGAALQALGAPAHRSIYVGNGDDFELEGATLVGMFSVRLGQPADRFYEVGESFAWDAQFDDLSEFVQACTDG